MREEHGVKDEAERPGITGSKSEARPKPSTETEPVVADSPSVQPGTGGDTPSAHQGARGSGSSPSPPRASSSTQGTRAMVPIGPPAATEKDNKALKRCTAESKEDQKEKKIKKQGGTKRVAEDGGDDAERGDRKSWKNYVEPASSSAATDGKGTKRDTQEEEEKKGKAKRQ